MDHNPPLSLLVPVPCPGRGASTRVQIGNSELVLEGVRGGHSFLWTNGRQARRHVLGLSAGGQLSLQLRAPALPVRVVPRELVTLVPGGRVAGYVHVSLVPTLVWHDEVGGSHVLVEVHPDDLTAEWSEETGHVLHGASPWYSRFPMRTGDARAIVPVRLTNAGSEALTPPHLDVRLADGDLVPLRGSIVAPPRRLRWTHGQLRADVRLAWRGGVHA